MYAMDFISHYHGLEVGRNHPLLFQAVTITSTKRCGRNGMATNLNHLEVNIYGCWTIGLL